VARGPFSSGPSVQLGRHGVGVITDKAGCYRPALAAAVLGVRHRAGRYRSNGIERGHGFSEGRLRPMRVLKSVASAAIFMHGDALMRNIRRRFDRIV
jgi:transposase-like protein